MTLLCDAIGEGSVSKCRQLLASGSNVEERDKAGWTPLQIAASKGYTELCQLLLDRGKAEIEETDADGNTALNLATSNGHASTVALLLSRKARVDLKNKKGFTPLLTAANKGYTEVCELLLDKGKADMTNCKINGTV